VLRFLQAAEHHHPSSRLADLNDLLDDLVDTTAPSRSLYGGDLRSLVTVMSGMARRSTGVLLPALDSDAAQLTLSTNISSVCSPSTFTVHLPKNIKYHY